MSNPEREINSATKASRAKELITFARTEVEKFHSREIDRISTNEERRKIKKERGLRGEEEKTIFPSREWAWMIGVLAGGGNINLKNRAINITGYDNNFLQIIKSTGERLFGNNARCDDMRKKEDGSVYKILSLHNRSISRQLGDLRRDKYFQTIIEKHRWIIENTNYTWGFLEGIFDTRGKVNKTQGVILSTTYPEIANFLSELLVRLDIKNPRTRYKTKSHEDIVGLGLYNKRDVKLFAQNVYSRRPEKEDILNFFRQTESKRKERITVDNRIEVIQEWVRLTRLLGHIPRSHEISNLRKDRKTKFSTSMYINRFGKVDGKRSFRAATKKLLELTKGKIEIQEVKGQGKPQDRKSSRLHTYKKEFVTDKKKGGISERAQKLINFVKSEIERFKRGEISRISSNEELREKFGYAHANTIIYHLKNSGLFEERSIVKKGTHFSKTHATLLSNEEALNEWIRIKIILNRIPTSNDIYKLYNQNYTKYSVNVYMHRFGMIDGKSSFLKARENIERIIREREQANAPKDVNSNGEEFQIFP